jgi:hypothetical protein
MLHAVGLEDKRLIEKLAGRIRKQMVDRLEKHALWHVDHVAFLADDSAFYRIPVTEDVLIIKSFGLEFSVADVQKSYLPAGTAQLDSAGVSCHFKYLCESFLSLTWR